jgi:hypothetical protein
LIQTIFLKFFEDLSKHFYNNNGRNVPTTAAKDKEKLMKKLEHRGLDKGRIDLHLLPHSSLPDSSR